MRVQEILDQFPDLAKMVMQIAAKLRKEAQLQFLGRGGGEADGGEEGEEGDGGAAMDASQTVMVATTALGLR